MKKLFMICNAHIDPVWLWKRQDGISAVLSTFRSAANLSEKYDFVFCHNESYAYEIVEKYDPELFGRMKKLIECGKWHIMGGWDIQPDCNMPSGESILRHIEEGRRYFKSRFDAVPSVAVNFDSFGHSNGLIQILSQCGYSGYVICRPAPDGSPIPENFVWEKNRRSVKVARPNDHYNSLRGEARKKAEKLIAENSAEYKLMLWGIGNHGGGPSEADLNDIAALVGSSEVEIFYATPEEYIAQDIFKEKVTESLNPCMPGCYTVQARVKQRHRLLESEYYLTEKICSHAALLKGKEYPATQLGAARKELLFSQFHDALPGTAIKDVEEQILRSMDYALHILENEKYDAFCALVKDKVKAASGEYPFFAYNSMPYAVRETVGIDFILENQNYDDYYVDLDVYVNGKKVPGQIVKEKSNINLDWAKRVIIDCELPPMSISRIGIFERHVEHKPQLRQNFGDKLVFDNGSLRAEINAATGLIDGVWCGVKQVIGAGSFGIDVIADNADPWAMDDKQRAKLGEKCGSFALLPQSELKDYIKANRVSGKNLRVVEDGDVLMRTEAIFRYGKSDAVVWFTFYKHHDYFDVDIRVNNNDTDLMYKLSMNLSEKFKLYGENMFGWEELKQTGCELVAQRWMCCKSETHSVNVYNRGTYGYSSENNALSMNLLRSVAYSAHPLEGRELLFDDRVIERIDCGVREYSFRVEVCANGGVEQAAQGARLFANPPYAESFWPDGNEKSDESLLELDNENIELSAFYKTYKGYIVRLYNASKKPECVTVNYKSSALRESVIIPTQEFRTYLLNGKELTEVDPIFGFSAEKEDGTI